MQTASGGGPGWAAGLAAARAHRYDQTMAEAWWHWLLFAGGGLAARIAFGVGILAVLLAVDVARSGWQSTRLREYAFLVAAVAGAMAYGLTTDMVTVTISPEYFIAHEDLSEDAVNLRAVAAVVALKATWSGGLILGALLLLANSLPRRWPPLPMGRLYVRLLYVAAAAGACTLLGGAAAWSGWFDALLDIPEGVGMRSFMCVYWAHIGAYAGGVLGGLTAIVSVPLRRRRAAAPKET